MSREKSSSGRVDDVSICFIHSFSFRQLLIGYGLGSLLFLVFWQRRVSLLNRLVDSLVVPRSRRPCVKKVPGSVIALQPCDFNIPTLSGSASPEYHARRARPYCAAGPRTAGFSTSVRGSTTRPSAGRLTKHHREIAIAIGPICPAARRAPTARRRVPYPPSIHSAWDPPARDRQ